MTDTWAEIHAGVLQQVRDYERARARNPSLHPTEPVPAREPESDVRFGHGDADLGGLVAAPRVLERLQHARAVHLLTAYGLDLAAELRRGGCTWLVREQQVLVSRPIRPLEQLRLRTRLLAAGPDFVWVEGMVLEPCPSGHALMAISWTRSVWTDLAGGRPAPHPARLTGLLAQIALGAPLEATLAARADAVAYELRRRP